MLEAVVLLFLVSTRHLFDSFSRLVLFDAELTRVHEFGTSQRCGRGHDTGREEMASANLEGYIRGQHRPRDRGEPGRHYGVDLRLGHVL